MTKEEIYNKITSIFGVIPMEIASLLSEIIQTQEEDRKRIEKMESPVCKHQWGAKESPRGTVHQAYCVKCGIEPKPECEHKFLDGKTLNCSHCGEDPFKKQEEKKQNTEELRARFQGFVCDEGMEINSIQVNKIFDWFKIKSL